MAQSAGTALNTPQAIEARLRADVVPHLLNPEPKPGSGTAQAEPAPTAAPPAPAPSSPAAPPAPPAPAPAPAQDPELLARIAQLEAENKASKSRKLDLPKLNLPSREQLDAMPQGEALTLLASALDGRTTAALEAVNQQLQSFNEDRLVPIQENLNAVRKKEAEGLLASKFPRLDLEKYRPRFEAVLKKHRGLDFEEAIRLVADPADLMPAEAPKIPASASAAHVDSGLPARTASTPAPKEPELSSTELMAKAHEARRSGDPFLANRLQEQAIKVKLGLNVP